MTFFLKFTSCKPQPGGFVIPSNSLSVTACRCHWMEMHCLINISRSCLPGTGVCEFVWLGRSVKPEAYSLLLKKRKEEKEKQKQMKNRGRKKKQNKGASLDMTMEAHSTRRSWLAAIWLGAGLVRGFKLLVFCSHSTMVETEPIRTQQKRVW